MKVNLTQRFIDRLVPQDADIYDTGQRGLVLRTRSTGRHTYRVALGRGKWMTLGGADVLTPTAARELAVKALGTLARGTDPRDEKRQAKAATLNAFLDNHYEKWALAHMKRGADFVGRIRRHFSPVFGSKPMGQITPMAIDRWRAARLGAKKPVCPGTVNRDVVALKACLAKAVEWRLLREHPIREVKLLREDNRGVVRFLSAEEERRLRATLAGRDEDRRAARGRMNQWLRDRGHDPLPEFSAFTDHMTPVVLLALNTGLRRGELLKLRWEDVDLVQAILTVRGEGAKSGRTRHVPLNLEAKAVLTQWSEVRQGLVFPGPDGSEMASLKTAWLAIAGRAKLPDFRFHDLRHTFASKLVQAGTDLNVVRELLGHASFNLTLRYAHLAAANKAEAVARLHTP